MPVVGEALVRVRVFSANLPGDIRNEVDRAARGADTDMNRLGQRMGSRLDESFNRRIGGTTERSIRRDTDRSRGRLSKLFKTFGSDLGGDLSKEFQTGIGAGKPGPAIVSMIALAGPSAVGAAAAVGVAAAGALVAAAASTLLTGGLLLAAFKSGADSIKPGLKAYKELGASFGVAVADGMADGFNTSATILRNGLLTPMYPILNRTGELLGNMFTNIAKTITIPENLARIGSILTTNEHFIDRFDTGLQGLTSSFLTLFAASKPMIDLVGDRFAEFGQWAASALAAAEANGNLGKVMDNLTKIASGLFDWLAKIGPAFGNWLLNLNPDKILAGFSAFGSILGTIGRIIGQIMAGAGPHFQQILQNIGDILTHMADTGVFRTVADDVATLIEKFTGLVDTLSQNPLVAKLLALAAAFGLFAGFLGPVMSLLGGLRGIVVAIGGALGEAAIPVAAIAGLFIFAYTQSQELRDAIAELWQTIQDKLAPVWDQLKEPLQHLWESLQRLGSILGQWLVPVVKLLAIVLGFLIPVIADVLVAVITGLTLIADFLTGFITGDWGPFIADILRLSQPLKDLWAVILAVWIPVWNTVVSFAGGFLTGLVILFHAYIDPITNWWNALWINVAVLAYEWWLNIADTANSLWTLIKAFIVQPVIDTYNQIVQTANSIIDAVNNAWNVVLVATMVIWTLVKAAIIQPIIDAYGSVMGAANNIESGLSGAWNSVLSTTESIWNQIFAAIIQPIEDAFSSAVSTASDIARGVASAFAGLVGTVSSIWESIKSAIVQPIADAYGQVLGWVDRIHSAISGVLDFINSQVSSANDKLGSLVTSANDKLGQVLSAQAAAQAAAGAFPPGGGAPPLGPVNAQLARGGVVLATPGGINAVVGEGRNNERIEPLDSQGLSRRDRALIGQIVSTMVSQSGQGAGPVQVRVMIGDRELTDVMTQVVQASNNALARRIAQRKHA